MECLQVPQNRGGGVESLILKAVSADRRVGGYGFFFVGVKRLRLWMFAAPVGLGFDVCASSRCLVCPTVASEPGVS